TSHKSLYLYFITGTSIVNEPAYPAYNVIKSDNPICLINDNVPSAEPSSLLAALSLTSTFSGAPSKIPMPIPASTLAIINVPSPSTQNGKKKNPITPITPA